MVEQLEAEAQLAKSSDRGRRRRPAHEDDDDEEADGNLRRFQEAREKANAIASSALAASGDSLTDIKKKKKRRMEVKDDGVDMELSATLARARQLAQLKQQQELASVVPPLQAEDKIAALVTSTTDENGDDKMSDAIKGNVFGEALQLLETKANAVVFNDATDFESRLRSAMEHRTELFATAQAAAKSAAVKKEEEERAGGKQEGKEEDDDAMEIDSGEEEQKKENEDEDGVGWADDQPLVGAGMGATLALLRRTGDLRDTMRVERQAGRANDARDRNVDDERRIKDGVKLDYRDEFGRLLTKKEAFRLLSYKFHGHKPGKKKQEKRLKQLKEELTAQKLLSGEGSTTMMKKLESKQGQAKQAFVVLSSGT